METASDNFLVFKKNPATVGCEPSSARLIFVTTGDLPGDKPTKTEKYHSHKVNSFYTLWAGLVNLIWKLGFFNFDFWKKNYGQNTL